MSKEEIITDILKDFNGCSRFYITFDSNTVKLTSTFFKNIDKAYRLSDILWRGPSPEKIYCTDIGKPFTWTYSLLHHRLNITIDTTLAECHEISAIKETAYYCTKAILTEMIEI